jgi:hypothetical protein
MGRGLCAAGSAWDGAMVFSLTGQGFLPRLSLSHSRPGGYSWAGPQSVKRSRYISGVLFSFSDREIQVPVPPAADQCHICISGGHAGHARH